MRLFWKGEGDGNDGKPGRERNSCSGREKGEAEVVESLFTLLNDGRMAVDCFVIFWNDHLILYHFPLY